MEVDYLPGMVLGVGPIDPLWPLVCVFHANGNVSRNAFFLMLACEVLEFQVRYASGNVSRQSSFGLTVSTALRTGRFAVSILAGMPCAIILSIVIHGSSHLWHLVWSGIAPVMLGGNLSRVFCLLQHPATSAKRAEPHLQLSPLQPRIRRSCILYIALQPVLRSMVAAVCLFGAASELAAPRGVFFTKCTYDMTLIVVFGSRQKVYVFGCFLFEIVPFGGERLKHLEVAII